MITSSTFITEVKSPTGEIFEMFTFEGKTFIVKRRIYLELIDKTINAKRFYELIITHSDKNNPRELHYATWGRIGKGGFCEKRAVLTCFNTMYTSKTRKGYKQIYEYNSTGFVPTTFAVGKSSVVPISNTPTPISSKPTPISSTPVPISNRVTLTQEEQKKHDLIESKLVDIIDMIDWDSARDSGNAVVNELLDTLDDLKQRVHDENYIPSKEELIGCNRIFLAIGKEIPKI